MKGHLQCVETTTETHVVARGTSIPETTDRSAVAQEEEEAEVVLVAMAVPTTVPHAMTTARVP